jgi:asparagine synthase (glutamine-hydrolysing)
LDLKHCVVEVVPPSPTEVGELVSAYAEPFGSASALGMLGVSRAVASSGSAKVLLTGDGGDDVFLGYSRHRNFWIAGNVGRFLPDGATNWGEAAGQAISTVNPLRRAGALLLYGAGGLGAMVRYSRQDDVREADRLLGERYGTCPRNPEAPHLPTSGRTILDDFLKYEFRTRFVGEYMTKVDGGTMHYGIEARSPFLDHKLWEFAAALPYGIRLHGGRLKSILRQLVRDEIGNDVARRPKRGFGIPVQRWIVGRWRPAIEEMFRNSVLEDERWIRPGSALARLGAAQDSGTAPAQLWYLVVLESWLRHERGLVANRQAIA